MEGDQTDRVGRLVVLVYVGRQCSLLQEGLESRLRRHLGVLGRHREQFLDVLLDAIAPDVSKAKAALSGVQLSLQDLDDRRERILQASRMESARFADIDSEGVEKLVTELMNEAVESLRNDPSIYKVATQLDLLEKEISGVEGALARLDNAFCETKRLALEQPPWKQSHLGV